MTINNLYDAKDIISVVIPVRDRWDLLKQSLNSLILQVTPPDFEVIVVDDGSRDPVPEYILQMKSKLSLRVIRQIPLGISAARNHGIEYAVGSLILFVDSDCYLHADCLINLFHSVKLNSEDVGFQLRLVGNRSTIVGRIENIRLIATQMTLLKDDGSIRYLNTAGYAMRTEYVKIFPELFNINMSRGEDTYLLYQLGGEGYLPRYVMDSCVTHQPELSLFSYLLKSFWVGYNSCSARRSLAILGSILMNVSDRKKALSVLWNSANGDKKDIIAFMLKVFIAYPIDYMGRFVYIIIGIRPKSIHLFRIPIEILRKEALFCRALKAAGDRKSIAITSIKLSSIVRAIKEIKYMRALQSFDICYPEKSFIGILLYITKLKRVHCININDSFLLLCKEIADRNITVGLVGSSKGEASFVKEYISKRASNIIIYASYFNREIKENEIVLEKSLVDAVPQIVFVGLEQPIQEYFVNLAIKQLPNTVFWCVGKLFFDISKKNRMETIS